MAKQTKQQRLGRKADPAGEEWHGKARAAWAKAVKDAEAAGSAQPIQFYNAPALPAWSKPRFVQREVYGRLVVDQSRGVVHDVENSTRECRIDAISSALFIHFLSELEQNAPDAELCEHCFA